MEREKVNKIINISLKILFSALFILIFIAVMNIEATKKSDEEIASILQQQMEERAKLAAGKPLNENIPDPWPPKMNKPYPKIGLIDKDGKAFNLSDHKGKVIILNFIDMSSPVSQAQAGSGLAGPYGVTQDVDQYTEPFADTVRKTVEDFSLPNDNVVEINVLVYAQDGAQTTVDDAANWATHFDLEQEQGVIVAIAQKDIRSEESDKIINGFQLIDQNHILRVDASGPEPKHNLKMTLIPMLPKLLR